MKKVFLVLSLPLVSPAGWGRFPCSPGLLLFMKPTQPSSPSAYPRTYPTLRTFAALGHPNYRLWFAGQVVSLFGTWMQSTAQGFLVYELTRSPAFLGYVGFAAGVPSWLFTLYGGVVADRVPRRTLLVVTQSAMMALAFVLAGLTFAGVVQPWHIILLAFMLGIANAFDAPARQSFVAELVPRADMTNAIALNSTMFNTATAIGPAVAGLTYAAFGPGWCFILNGVSFIAVIAALLAMKLPAFHAPERRSSAVSDLKEGFHFVLSHPKILTIMGMMSVVSLFGASFSTLFPAWAVEVLRGDATTNGLLRSSMGLGSLAGALTIATLGGFKYRGRLLTAGTLAYPLFLFLFSGIRNTPLSLLTLVGLGFSMILVMNLSNALVQTEVTDAVRGRVMGMYTLIFFGLMPLGALLAGSVAARFSEPVAAVFSASVLMAAAIGLYLFAPHLRRME